MTARPVLEPGPDHPITIEPTPGTVIVKVAGRVVARSRRALTLREAALPPVRYLPPEDVDASLLTATDHATYCPYKGDCDYFSIPLGGARSTNAVWRYAAPYPAVAAIAGRLAFWPGRVDSIEVVPD